ncbi:MAG TPA: ABC transporter permease subunit [Thermoanaerobaculia bacterium]|nr:ABC transporter permease subunit [Thermoanaerobaculia bacterium]
MTSTEDLAPAARVASDAPRGVFRALVRKEIADQTHGRRFVVGALLCIALCALASWIRVEDYRQSHRLRDEFLQRWVPAVQEQLQRDENVQVENTRAVSPLTTLSVGLEPTVPFRFSSTKEGLRYGETRGAQNTVDALFGYMDVAFIIGTLLSLLAIALTFDSICGDRSDGTLAVLLSYPVSRATLLAAKVVGAMAVLIACLLPSILIVALIMIVRGVTLMSLAHWAIYGFAAIVYLLIFVLIGVTVSARARHRSEAALAGLVVWVAFVFIVPRVATVLVNGFASPSRAVELALQEDAVTSKLKVEFAQQRQRAFEAYIGAQGSAAAMEEFERTVQEATDAMRTKRRAQLARIWDQRDREEARRQQLVSIASLVSPSALFSTVAAELCWTGYAQRDHFYEQSRAYDERVGRNLAESRYMYFAQTGPDGTGRAMITRASIRPYLQPFRSTWIDSSRILREVILPLVALIVIAGLFYFLAYESLLRLDVRLS